MPGDMDSIQTILAHEIVTIQGGTSKQTPQVKNSDKLKNQSVVQEIMTITKTCK